jgi:hypothetical protein
VLVTAAVGLLALALEAAGDKRDLAFTIGVVPNSPAATLRPGDTVCQSGITVPERFTRIGLRAGSPGGPTQPLALSVRRIGSNRELAEGELAGGQPYGMEVTAPVGEVEPGERIAVCVRNAGSRRVEIYGNVGAAALPSQALQNGRTLPTDLTLIFLAERRSLLSQLPEVFDRASLFRPGWVGAWTFWVLSALALLGVPMLLARALADSSDAP